MNRRVALTTLCIVAVIAWAGAVWAQTATPNAMKMVKLPSGEEVFDLSGRWEVSIENYGVYERHGSYPQSFEVTQDGKSFRAIRLKDNPPPVPGKAGSKCAQGELDKSGIHKLELMDGGDTYCRPSGKSVRMETA